MKAIRDWMNEQGVKNPVGEALTYNSLLCPFNPRLVLGVGVGIHQGGRRGVLGVPLDRLEVAAGLEQLIGCAGVSHPGATVLTLKDMDGKGTSHGSSFPSFACEIFCAGTQKYPPDPPSRPDAPGNALPGRSSGGKAGI